MAIKSGLFNSVNGDRKYKADFFAEYFATFISNGVFPNPSTGLQVIAGTGMTVNVKAGKAWIKGYYFANDADYTLQLDVADGVLKRIDRIGLRLDFLSREIVPVIIKGVFASNPVAPALQRDADAYELALADVFINNGAISISQANITDTRLNNDLCGIVHGTVNQVDTTTIFNQYLAWFTNYSANRSAEFDSWQLLQEQDFNTWSAQKRGNFDAWFASIQNILSGDVAGNLQAQITALDGRMDTLEQTVATHKAEKATDTTLGHVKQGIGVTIDPDGTLNVVSDVAKFKKGNSTFTDNDTSQIFTDAFCTSSSLVTIVITSGTPPQGVWSVEGEVGSFTITSTLAETAPITFDYFIQKAVG
ncbi:hypothetical protein JNUCC23_02010 [Peribacillus sp. JNUCC 23]